LRLSIFALPALMFACDPSESTDDFTTGDFSFQTVAVDDACFDGGFAVLFQPDGADTPSDFGSSITVPAEVDLPSSYSVSLAAPFNDMDVDVTGSGSTRTIRGALNTDVELDADAYPGCLVDMSIDVDLTISSADEVSGTATLNTSSFDEENCPLVDSDPCTITLDIVGTR
jgi:hypothetical protein